MDETRPPTPTPDATPPKRTRDTRGGSTDLTPGELREYPDVPGYDLLGVLGHGGMGVVYKARQVGANRLIALKMIRAMEYAMPHERLRFQIEAEAVARLQHPNIVQLYEVGEVRGLPYFSLELCDGGTLTRQLKTNPPTPREAAELIEALARAMHYAHLRGVVHRDLKPANVLFAGAQRVPKITDFGLAKRIDADARDVSQSGAVMGTAGYMAPEQAAGRVRDTGPAADVYALGALLYECLTGRPPFDGPQHEVLLRVLADEPVPPRRLNPRVPADLQTVCLKCLNKEPARRYASAEALADDLQHFQTGEPILARPVGAAERAWKWAKRRPTAAALTLVSVAALLALLIGGWWFNARLTEQRNEALKEAARAERARDFLIGIFRVAETDALGGNITARQILADAERRIPEEFAGQPELRAELEAAIGEVKRGIARKVPLAMILEVRGAVALRSQQGDDRRAVPQMLLNLDDRLTLAPDSHARLVFLADLHQVRLKPGREVAIGERGCDPGDAVLDRDDSPLMTFVRLPKGTFTMGFNSAIEPGEKQEIRAGFEIAAHDVTQGQWQAVMGGNPSWFSRTGGGSRDVRNISDEELKLFPVERVSWDDAQEFIRRLNELERRHGYVYRLPTGAEWEYACRGGSTSQEECSYHFYLDRPTNDLSSQQANFDGNFPAGNAPRGEHLQRTTRVGAYPPNRLGLYDMHGNVWQWCQDLEESERVLRGGGWSNRGNECRAGYHNRYVPSNRFNFIGFRLVRVPAR